VVEVQSKPLLKGSVLSRLGWWLPLAAILLLGAGVRLAVIFSPLGEIDGDEAVVGLMARHIAFLGERPVFYYGQPYLGSLEAFSAAPLFVLFDSSTLALKLIPTLYSLGFLTISAIVARRLFGVGPALATAAYLAMPPSMWAVWSTKARGGYAELLFLGEAMLLATLALAASTSRKLAFLTGILAGLAFWTHLLAVVYLVPAAVYLVLRRRARWQPAELGLLTLGTVLGMLPLLFHNVVSGYPTLMALLQPPDLPLDPVAQFIRFFRVGVPVLAGLGQPTTSEVLFDADWLTRPAGNAWVALLLLVILLGGLALHLPSLKALIRNEKHAEPALLLMVAMLVPPIVAVTRFGFFVSEPRYALPLYAGIPLLAASLWRLPLLLRWIGLAAVLALNVWSLLSTDIRLWRPQDALNSTAGTRAELMRQVTREDRHQLYTDYWIGYPIMFESRETVLAYVISGGFNRYLPPADNVQRTPNPAWVFTPGSEAEQVFLDQLRTLGGTAQVRDMSIYRVYTDVQPLAAMRPPG
jgi:4-amino-4-deoxy-L-arabinose transferase-like glycosyltransferase